MKEKILKILFSILYSKSEVIGNKYLLASNKILHEVRINDIELIYEFAKFIEENTKNDIDGINFNKIYDKFDEILTEYLNE